MIKIQKWIDDLESSLWLRPTVWLVSMAVLAVALITIDRLFLLDEIRALLPWFLKSGGEEARTMLGAISTGMLTVTSLAFSLTMVTVVQTANAYSPRILRQYLGDTHNQHVFGVLIGTFLYSLLVLRAVRSGENTEFVPVLATNMAIILSVIATGALIYFINHVSQSIKVSNIIQLIFAHTKETAATLFPENVGQPWIDAVPELPQRDPIVLTSEQSGYIQLFDPDSVLHTAAEGELLIRAAYIVGDYVLEDAPLVEIWSDQALTEEQKNTIRRAFILGRERSFTQDVRFGLRQLSDIALRAISPAVNDPTTTINAIDSLASLLSQLMKHGRIIPYRCDDSGRLRLIFPDLTFADLLEEAYMQIVHYGLHDYMIFSRLIEICGQLGASTDDTGYHQDLWEFVVMMMQKCDSAEHGSMEQRRINERLQQTAAKLKQDPEPHYLK